VLHLLAGPSVRYLEILMAVQAVQCRTGPASHSLSYGRMYVSCLHVLNPTVSFLAFLPPPIEKTVEMATCWIAAEHPLRHVEKSRHQIESTFAHCNIGKSEYAVYAGFDESCIQSGSGYLEQIHVFALSKILVNSPLLAELGKVLSPFSSIQSNYYSDDRNIDNDPKEIEGHGTFAKRYFRRRFQSICT